jgi:hypothetical protein
MTVATAATITAATTSCAGTKKTTVAPETHFDFSSSVYTLVGKGALWQNGEKTTFNVTLKLYKDSLIWANFSLLGIEGARMVVHPDTVHVLNRMDRRLITYGGVSELIRHRYPVRLLSQLLVGKLAETEMRRLKTDNERLDQTQIEYESSGAYVSSLSLKNAAGRVSFRTEEKLKSNGLSIPRRCRFALEGAQDLRVEVEFHDVRQERACVRPGFNVPKDYAHKCVSVAGMFN